MNATVHRSHRIGAGFPFTSFWYGFTRFFSVVNQARAADSDFKRLLRSNDAQLAQMGLTRQNIAQHIARKHF